MYELLNRLRYVEIKEGPPRCLLPFHFNAYVKALVPLAEKSASIWREPLLALIHYRVTELTARLFAQSIRAALWKHDPQYHPLALSITPTDSPEVVLQKLEQAESMLIPLVANHVNELHMSNDGQSAMYNEGKRSRISSPSPQHSISNYATTPPTSYIKSASSSSPDRNHPKWIRPEHFTTFPPSFTDEEKQAAMKATPRYKSLVMNWWYERNFLHKTNSTGPTCKCRQCLNSIAHDNNLFNSKYASTPSTSKYAYRASSSKTTSQSSSPPRASSSSSMIQ